MSTFSPWKLMSALGSTWSHWILLHLHDYSGLLFQLLWRGGVPDVAVTDNRHSHLVLYAWLSCQCGVCCSLHRSAVVPSVSCSSNVACLGHADERYASHCQFTGSFLPFSKFLFFWRFILKNHHNFHSEVDFCRLFLTDFKFLCFCLLC